ncbi:MAG: hypothetical protein LBE62_07165, partial [Azonexus sp.]|nr:hypothetical protein [Azonexus sp.]
DRPMWGNGFRATPCTYFPTSVKADNSCATKPDKSICCQHAVSAMAYLTQPQSPVCLGHFTAFMTATTMARHF